MSEEPQNFSRELYQLLGELVEKISEDPPRLNKGNLDEVEQRLAKLKRTADELEEVSRAWVEDQKLEGDVITPPEKKPGYMDDASWELIEGIRSIRKEAWSNRKQLVDRMKGTLRKICEEEGINPDRVAVCPVKKKVSDTRDRGDTHPPQKDRKESRRARFRRIGGRRDWKPI